MNKKFLVLPLVLLAFGCRDQYEGQAGATSSPAPAAPYGSERMASPAAPAVSGAAVTATVVEVDPAGGTITLREVPAPGAPASDTAGRRYNVAPSAASGLADFKPGQQVNVICETAPAATASGSAKLVDCVTVTTIAEAGGATGQ